MNLNEIEDVILRSLCSNEKEEWDYAIENFRKINSRFGSFSLNPTRKKFLTMVRESNSFKGGPPKTSSIIFLAKEQKDEELKIYAEKLALIKPEWGSSFIILVDQYLENVGLVKINDIIMDINQIATDGLQEGKVIKKGLSDAISQGIVEFTNLRSATDASYESMANEEASQALRKQYIERRDKPCLAYGLPTGLNAMDEVTRGGQYGELWTLAGFTSHGKSTLVLNWMWHLAMCGGFNIHFFSLEMSHELVWRILACIHSSHPRWEGRPLLEYEKIKSGTLSKEDEDWYINEILPDIRTNEEYGRIVVDTPTGDTNLMEIRGMSEALNQTVPLDVLVIDYLSLLGPHPLMKGNNRSSSDVMNFNFKQSKILAQTFDQGNKILVVTPHQINRQGFERARENGGVYDIRAISDANEAERSSDNLLCIYHDEALRQKSEAVITHLKNRDGALVQPFSIYMDGAHRKTADLDLSVSEGESRNLSDLI